MSDSERIRVEIAFDGQQVLSLYYCDNLNLKEIGSVLGVTESRVCQIHGEATRRLRDSLGELAAEAAA